MPFKVVTVKTLRLKDFDFSFPETLVAQHQLSERTASKLLVVDRKTHTLNHTTFKELPDFLNKADCLVLNNSKVIPARLIGKKSTGGQVEVFLLKYQNETNQWQVLIRGKNITTGNTLFFARDLVGEVQEISKTNGNWMTFNLSKTGLDSLIEEIGEIPLPPYIKRAYQSGEQNTFYQQDKANYQTVFAKHPGSVAAPTAGLHFDQNLLDQITAKGTTLAEVSLHVGLGTFLPVKSDDIAAHQMHHETYHMSAHHIEKINRCRAGGGRVVCVGTTSFRTLESNAQDGILHPGAFSTNLFIYPQEANFIYQPQICDALLTNFHQPKSTLFMLIAALLSLEFARHVYDEAISRQYRLFSFGDAMLIL